MGASAGPLNPGLQALESRQLPVGTSVSRAGLMPEKQQGDSWFWGREQPTSTWDEFVTSTEMAEGS